MGFFSAVKKFFGKKEEAPAIEPDKAPEVKGDLMLEAPESAGELKDQEAIATANAPQQSVEKSAENYAEHAPRAKAEIKPEIKSEIESGQTVTAEKEPQENQEPIEQPEITPKTAEKTQASEISECETIAEAPVEIEENLNSIPIQVKEPAELELASKTEEKTPTSSEDDALLLALRNAEPRLSAWLAIVLEGQEEINPVFWKRLQFLLQSLDAPENEIRAFLEDFKSWLKAMEYNYIDEFRSELQYRLALALDLEDEEDERNRLILKLSQSLSATREQLGRRLDSLFASHSELNEAFWEEMEELFIMADLGYEPSLEIVRRLKNRASRYKATKAEDARQLLQDELEEIFKIQPRIRAANKPEVILMMGVNGAGKTTTIAKLAHRSRMDGKKVLVVAADTFRAAAMEQLEVWAKRAGADFYARPAGSDPASVAWEAMDYAVKNDIDVVYVDTAGRLQTRVNLMEELGKIRQVLGKKHPGAPHRSMLVLDATTGQNALSQAKLFRDAAGADEIALTKLDGTAKGGVAIAVAMQEGLPITYIGLGEKMEDLRPFNGRDFALALLGEAS